MVQVCSFLHIKRLLGAGARAGRVGVYWSLIAILHRSIGVDAPWPEFRQRPGQRATVHAPTIPPRLPHMAVVVAPNRWRARAVSRSARGRPSRADDRPLDDRHEHGQVVHGLEGHQPFHDRGSGRGVDERAQPALLARRPDRSKNFTVVGVLFTAARPWKRPCEVCRVCDS
jgi:hypothetical protein